MVPLSRAGAIGWVKPAVNHHRPDDVGCAHRRTRPAQRNEHTARQTSWFGAEIRLADPLCRDRLRLQLRKQTDGRWRPHEPGANWPICCWARAIIPAISARSLASAGTTGLSAIAILDLGTIKVLSAGKPICCQRL